MKSDEALDLIACLRALFDALIAAGVLTHEQVATAAQERLLKRLEGLPPELHGEAYPFLREMAVWTERLGQLPR